MLLPKEISPNPLITSTVEVRFISDFREDETLSIFYAALGKTFPKVKGTNIPKEIRSQRADLKYAPEFVLSNDKYSLSIGKNVIAFENIGTYHLWHNYFQMIRESLAAFNHLNLVRSIERVGVRYASIFDYKDTLSNILNVNPFLGVENYQQKVQHIRTELKKNNITLLVQIAQNARAEKPDKVIEGVYIDIDASTTHALPYNFGKEALDIIEVLHQEEKRLFFSLLKEDYLKKLNPKY